MTTEETEELPFDEDDLRSLGHKLAQLELTERERAAMAALLSDDDVAGFGRFNIVAGVRAGYVVTPDLQKWDQGGRHDLQTDGIVGPKTFRPGRF